MRNFINKQEVQNYIEQGLCSMQIAKKMNRSDQTIRTFVKRNNLKPKRAQNPFKNKVNEKYGKLLVIENIIPSQGEHVNNGGLWKCLCDCGNTIEINGVLLGRAEKDRKSCGCLAKKSANLRRKYQETTINIRYCHHERNGKQGNRGTLNRQDWESIVFLPCHYCGKIDVHTALEEKGYRDKIDTITKEEQERYSVKINGVDRIDSTKGYEKDNCISCCKMCNWMKLDYLPEEFLKHVEEISIFQKSKK